MLKLIVHIISGNNGVQQWTRTVSLWERNCPTTSDNAR